MIEDMCKGTPFRSARGLGRTFVANILGAYIAWLFSCNKDDETVENKYPVWLGINANIVPEEFVNAERAKMDEAAFEREYSLGYKPGEVL